MRPCRERSASGRSVGFCKLRPGRAAKKYFIFDLNAHPLRPLACRFDIPSSTPRRRAVLSRSDRARRPTSEPHASVPSALAQNMATENAYALLTNIQVRRIFPTANTPTLLLSRHRR